MERPYKDVDHMNEALIHNWNQRVKPEDTVYHLGDFMFRGGWQGGNDPVAHFEDALNGKIIHLLGNHDKQNRIKNSIRYAEIWFANRRWCLQHKPPEEPHLRVFPVDTGLPPVYLVGHVHQNWKHKLVKDTLVVNVGVDVWNYMPITQQEITVYVDRFYKEKRLKNKE